MRQIILGIIIIIIGCSLGFYMKAPASLVISFILGLIGGNLIAYGVLEKTGRLV